MVRFDTRFSLQRDAMYRSRILGPIRLAVVIALIVGLAAGWLGHRFWNAPGAGSLEGGRAAIVAP